MKLKTTLAMMVAVSALAFAGCAQKSAAPAEAEAPTASAPSEAAPSDSGGASAGGEAPVVFEGTPPAKDAQASDPVGGAGPDDERPTEVEEAPPTRAELPSTSGGVVKPPKKQNPPKVEPQPSGGGWTTSPPPPPPPPPPSSAPGAPPSPTGSGADGAVIEKNKDGTTKVTVYFATDRKQEISNDVRRFTGEEVNGLYYGTVDVSIPPMHEVGAVESPQWWKMEFSATPEKHVVYQGFNLLSRDGFYGSLANLINKSANKEAFVFIHGFNTSFENAARRTAQIEYDLKFDGAPIFYSWPSQGELSPLAYSKDATSSDRTVPRLTFFLKEVSKRTGAKRIHLIAHSMGNKAMVNALARVADEMTTGEKPLFNQIVLTAPDIDREVFMDIAKRIQKAGSQVTLYASRNDKALQASKTFNGFPRAGDATGAPVIVPGIATIDASAVTTDYFGLNHDFFATQRTVLSDLQKLLRTGASPDIRRLRKVKDADGAAYWVID